MVKCEILRQKMFTDVVLFFNCVECPTMNKELQAQKVIYLKNFRQYIKVFMFSYCADSDYIPCGPSPPRLVGGTNELD